MDLLHHISNVYYLKRPLAASEEIYICCHGWTHYNLARIEIPFEFGSWSYSRISPWSRLFSWLLLSGHPDASLTCSFWNQTTPNQNKQKCLMLDSNQNRSLVKEADPRCLSVHSNVSYVVKGSNTASRVLYNQESWGRSILLWLKQACSKGCSMYIEYDSW